RGFAILFISGLFGSGFGVAVGFFLFPYILPPLEALEQLAVEEDAAPVAAGTFSHANPIHYGTGTVKIFESTLFLEDNFKVEPRPKYHIYLIPKAGIQANGDLINQMCVDLIRLRTFKDSQNYRIPEGTDLASFKSVIIWCEKFNVLISPADHAFKTRLTIRQASHENREDRRFQL
ncbi:MAG: DM13 domain-containing protein, partial [Pseudomonadota bacterium]|nr:DM13 domain-containing protein [Pseudomonadota bacterium]